MASKPTPRHVHGMSLIELMISMVLGLLVVGGAIGIFMSNRQTYRATENLGRMQESARVAFELMAREVRQAGGNPCGNNLPVANLLKSSGSNWWTNWGDGVVGYEGGEVGAPADMATGTDAIQLMSATSGAVGLGEDVEKNKANFKVATPDHGLESFDIVMICDYGQASIFQVTSANDSNVTIVHNTGNVASGPGNCSKNLGLPVPTECAGGGKGSGVYYPYGMANSTVTKLEAAQWFVAENDRDGRSLWRVRMDQGEPQPRQEVVEGIQDMQIQYLVKGSTVYADATPALDWGNVTAVRIELEVQGADRVGTDGEPLTRNLAHVVTLRNRVP